MKLKTLFKTIVVGTIYCSIRKLIDRLPEPVKIIVVWSIRVFLLIFLLNILTSGILSNLNSLLNDNWIWNLVIAAVKIVVIFAAAIFSFFIIYLIEQFYMTASEIYNKVYGASKAVVDSGKDTAAATKETIKGVTDKVTTTAKNTAKNTADITIKSTKVVAKGVAAVAGKGLGIIKKTAPKVKRAVIGGGRKIQTIVGKSKPVINEIGKSSTKKLN
ncbi:hypothetical protein ACFL3D_07090, partial [Candidatus Omnitrophota bacterium]